MQVATSPLSGSKSDLLFQPFARCSGSSFGMSNTCTRGSWCTATERYGLSVFLGDVRALIPTQICHCTPTCLTLFPHQPAPQLRPLAQWRVENHGPRWCAHPWRRDRRYEGSLYIHHPSRDDRPVAERRRRTQGAEGQINLEPRPVRAPDCSGYLRHLEHHGDDVPIPR